MFNKKYIALTLVSYTAFIVALPGWAGPFSGDDEVVTSSYFGTAGDRDEVVSAAFREDGSVLLLANTGDSSAELVHMDSDGQEVLGNVKLKTRVSDMAFDGQKRIIIATDMGVARVAPNLSTTEELYKTSDWVKRIDVSEDGRIAALVGGKKHSIHWLDPSGKLLQIIPGKNATEDVCIDDASQSIIFTGYRNAYAHDGKKNQPVQICYIRSVDFDGKVKWNHYDWSTDREADNFLNRPENNMADTRGYRCAIGADGLLYIAFESAGGNHLFRYMPDDVMQKADALVADGDDYHKFHNTRSEHKTVIGRFNPETGMPIKILEFTARKNSGDGNSIRIKNGEITADESGRVYLVGRGFFGMPMTYMPEGTGDYTGGPFLAVFNERMNGRVFVTRMTEGGEARAVAVETIKPGYQRIVYGGGPFKPAEKPLFIKNAVRDQPQGQEGFFAIFELNDEDRLGPTDIKVFGD
jgi:hypothetical protein